jgi:hypothetical protein
MVGFRGVAWRFGSLTLILISMTALDARAEPQAAPQEDAGAAAQPSDKDEIAQLKAEVSELKARMDAADEVAIAEAGVFRPSLDVYGYLTLELSKWIVDDDDPFKGIINTNLSFGMQNLNVYFSSHMTETLSALVEVGFTAMPHGLEKSYLPYERYDSRVADPRDTQSITLGSIYIPRAIAVWQPYDAFGVTAGKFLTPYGIWNTDHSPVVILPINIPYVMVRETIPADQTGVAIQGRFFPGHDTYLDYAVTLSNGRGPTQEVYDLDDNKAVGLRLKGSYEKGEFGISLGAYGFYGTMTDSTKVLDPDPDDFMITIKTTEKYRELAAAADLKITLWGVLIQSEFAGGIIKYLERPQKAYPIVNVAIPGEYQPDFLRWDAYVLLGWNLPLSRWLGEKTITLYTMGERSIMDDTDPNYNVWMLRWGIDFTPVNFVVLKIDAALLMMPESDIIAQSRPLSIGAQLAVAF